MESATLSGIGGDVHSVSDTGRFAITFRRDGDVTLSVPSDFGPKDWAMSGRVVRAVEHAVRPAEPSAKDPLGIEDTQPISTWFLPK